MSNKFNIAPPKICLIVDNPVRDLEGLVLIAAELARRGCEPYLVPMYTQGYEVPALCPDFVLLNFARKANVDLIRNYHRAGIGVGVMDTEGGVWESPSQFVKSIAYEDCRASIDRYFFWGNNQKEAFANEAGYDESILKVTGSPRYDLYAPQLRQSIQSYTEESNFILIVSNFAISYPRFATPQIEIENMVTSGYEKNYVLSRLDEEKRCRAGLVSLIRKLSEDFCSHQIIVRTHPFEDDADYKKLFSGLKNVKIVRHGSVATWLASSAVAIHFNSSVAVDAALLGRPILTLDWLASEISRGMSHLTHEISYKLRDYDEMKAILNQLLQGKPWGAYQAMQDRSLQILKPWYGELDGMAHQRICDDILDYIEKKERKVNRVQCARMAFYGSRSLSNWKGYIDSLGRMIFGVRTYQALRKKYLTRNILKGTKGDKFFEPQHVQNCLDRLQMIETIQRFHLQASMIDDAYTILPRLAGESVRVNAALEENFS